MIKKYENLGSGKDFLVKHTKALDAIISLMYETVLRQVFTNYLPMRGIRAFVSHKKCLASSG